VGIKAGKPDNFRNVEKLFLIFFLSDVIRVNQFQRGLGYSGQHWITDIRSGDRTKPQRLVFLKKVYVTSRQLRINYGSEYYKIRSVLV